GLAMAPFAICLDRSRQQHFRLLPCLFLQPCILEGTRADTAFQLRSPKKLHPYDGCYDSWSSATRWRMRSRQYGLRQQTYRRVGFDARLAADAGAIVAPELAIALFHVPGVGHAIAGRGTQDLLRQASPQCRKLLGIRGPAPRDLDIALLVPGNP